MFGKKWVQYCRENKVWDSVMLFEEAGCAGGLMTNRNKSPDLKLSQTMPDSGSLKLEHLYLFCSTTGLRKGLVCVNARCGVHVSFLCMCVTHLSCVFSSCSWGRKFGPDQIRLTNMHVYNNLEESRCLPPPPTKGFETGLLAPYWSTPPPAPTPLN